LERAARTLIRSSLAPLTLAKHRWYFKVFAAWCERHGRETFPPSTETVALFLSDAAERYGFLTIRQFVDTIAFAHRTAGLPFSRGALAPVLNGIARTHGTGGRRMAPIAIGELRSIVACLPDSLRGARDRALLTLGFAGALRASELIGLDIGGAGVGARGVVAIDGDGVRITLFRSKTDQKGKGIFKLLPRGGDPCPVATLEQWLAMAGIAAGPIFREVSRHGVLGQRRLGPLAVGCIVKRAVYDSALRAGAGESVAQARAGRVASHSLRAGFVTSAALAKVPSEEVADHVGWTSTRMVYRYQRLLDPAESNAAALVLNC
jgi:integrase